MIYPDPGIDGWMGTEELQWLFDTSHEMTSIVEVGSWMGKSTHALLSGCKSGPVFAVDHFMGSASELEGAHGIAKNIDIYSVFKRQVGRFGNLVVLKMASLDAAQYFRDRSVDMVFIDADHEYPAVKEDIEAWRPKARKLLCGHDCEQGGTPRAFTEIGITPIIGPKSIWRVSL